jgi:hypothetical protein
VTNWSGVSSNSTTHTVPHTLVYKKAYAHHTSRVYKYNYSNKLHAQKASASLTRNTFANMRTPSLAFTPAQSSSAQIEGTVRRI